MIYMGHICGPVCDCKLRLQSAMAALEESSRLLSASVCAGPAEQVEKCFASFRTTKSTLFDALDFCDPRVPDRSLEPA